MYVPKSFLSRLLGAAWTVFLIALLLWVAICLLERIWIWIVAISAIGTLTGIGIWLQRWRRERW